MIKNKIEQIESYLLDSTTDYGKFFNELSSDNITPDNLLEKEIREDLLLMHIEILDNLSKKDLKFLLNIN